jgi:hypothetical protein
MPTSALASATATLGTINASLLESALVLRPHAMAERPGFEPGRRYKRLRALQARSLNHSDISPGRRYLFGRERASGIRRMHEGAESRIMR